MNNFGDMEKIHYLIRRRCPCTTYRFFYLALPLCFFWVLYVITMQLDFQKHHINKDYLRESIVKLSKEYVRVVAKERREEVLGIDGQTNIELKDLRQITAILLKNMLDRLQVLERQVENVVTQSAQDISELSQQLKYLNESIRTRFNFSHVSHGHRCKIPNDPSYPKCATKVKWLAEHWKSDRKFSRNGVNGSLCSFLHYLSKVESFCPRSKSHRISTDCQLPNEHDYPDCKTKVQWMLSHWRSDTKFSANGVNGSICSILIYLSEVEIWCPFLPHRQKIHKNDCKIPQHRDFPHCEAKVIWMKSSWKTDPCYAQEYGVNGTICSFLSYLSEVEQWCPKSSGSSSIIHQTDHGKVDIKSTSMNKLMDKLTNVIASSRLAWIRLRAQRMWDYWVDGLNELQARVNATDKPKKKVLVHVGVLAEENHLHFAATAGKGGPLGELVQWCDLIVSLYVLGHEVQVTVDHQEFTSALGTKRSCPPKGGYKFDLIFTDYYGLKLAKRKIAGVIGLYGCRLRIVDSFGTEAQFNYAGMLPRFAGNQLNGGGPNGVGKYNLNLKQYMTMFPHSPDNTFLGFVVDSKKNVPTAANKKPKALTYGKHYYMWKDLTNRGFLDAIHEHFEIHATTGGLPLEQVKKFLPDYVINHGLLPANRLQEILRESKLFIGLGFPYEGPAPLEAIAQGCFFLNPKFNPPKNRANTKFFRGKPTFRSLTSQHPYAEEFIGEPRVLTVDINDVNAVKTAVKKIIDSQSSPYLPFEYTHEGMLERINALLHNQDLCNPVTRWPPLNSRKIFVGKAGESCKDICLANDLVCEPAFFPSINNVESLKMASFPCNTDKPLTRQSLVAPAYIADEHLCVLQQTPVLYSCTVSHHLVRRVCPCRDYRKGQVALCKTCY